MNHNRNYDHVMQTYNRQPVEFVRGEGVYLFDADGNRYIDMVSGLGVVALGHAHPAVAEAASEQLQTLVHTSNLYYTQPMGRLAERLAHLSLGGRCFFGNSGAEANEAAIKLARKHGRVYLGGAHEIVALNNSFHGRTFAALSATGQPEKWEAFAPMLPGFVHVPMNDIDALRAAVTDKTCAVMIEVIQGEGGVQPADHDWARQVRQLCTDKNILLIVDEVQTGLGRTGKWFAYQHFGIEPDAITVAKALANGLPIGALITTPKYESLLAPGDHASTFGGGPVVCAAALAVLEELSASGLIDSAEYLGRYLRERLLRLADDSPMVVGVRGKGLMLALELADGISASVVAESLKRGLIVNNVRPDAIRLLPPLVITESQIDEAVGILSQALEGGGTL